MTPEFVSPELVTPQSLTPQLVLDCRAIIAESMLWVPEEGRLYFIDVKMPALHALRLDNGTLRSWHLPAEVGGFALNGRGQALVALRYGLYWLSLANNDLQMIVPSPFDPALIRFNECACDSRGRFWIGTMTDPSAGVQTTQTGGLYCYTSGTGLRAYPDFAHVTNGMAWNVDESIFFLSHSQERVIYQYEYDRTEGRLSTRRAFATIKSQSGQPDGAAVDTEGGYWCAIHGAGCLHRYGPDGALTLTVPLPVSQPTMCCFAGAARDELYITSARNGLDVAALREQPLAGGLFRIKPPFPGIERHWRVV